MWLLKTKINMLEYFIRLMEWLRFAPRIVNPMPVSDITFIYKQYAETNGLYVRKCAQFVSLSAYIHQAINNLRNEQKSNSTYYTLELAIMELQNAEEYINEKVIRNG